MAKEKQEKPKLELAPTVLITPESAELDLENEPTGEETPETAAAKLARIEAAALKADHELSAAVLQVERLKTTAAESARVDEIKEKEQTLFSGLKDVLGRAYWKLRSIGKAPETVEAIKLIAKAQQGKKKPKEMSEVERTQMMLKKISQQTHEEYGLINPKAKKIESGSSLINYIENWTPALSDDDEEAAEWLANIMVKFNSARDVYTKNPDSENVKNELKTILEITGAAPATEEVVEEIWASGKAGAIIRAGETRIDDYFHEAVRAYPQVLIEINKKNINRSFGIEQDKKAGANSVVTVRKTVRKKPPASKDNQLEA